MLTLSSFAIMMGCVMTSVWFACKNEITPRF